MSSVRPTIPRSAPNRRFQRPSDSSAVRCFPCCSSSASKVRPNATCTSSMEKKAGETRTPRTASGAVPPARGSASVTYQFRHAARWSKPRLSWRQSRKLPGDGSTSKGIFSRLLSWNHTSRSTCAIAGGRKSSVSITLKIAVFAPMPNARVSTATLINPGWRRTFRDMCDASCHALSSHDQSHTARASSFACVILPHPEEAGLSTQRHGSPAARSRPLQPAQRPHSTSVGTDDNELGGSIREQRVRQTAPQS